MVEQVCTRCGMSKDLLSFKKMEKVLNSVVNVEKKEVYGKTVQILQFILNN